MTLDFISGCLLNFDTYMQNPQIGTYSFWWTSFWHMVRFTISLTCKTAKVNFRHQTQPVEYNNSTLECFAVVDLRYHRRQIEFEDDLADFFAKETYNADNFKITRCLIAACDDISAGTVSSYWRKATLLGQSTCDQSSSLVEAKFSKSTQQTCWTYCVGVQMHYVGWGSHLAWGIEELHMSLIVSDSDIVLAILKSIVRRNAVSTTNGEDGTWYHPIPALERPEGWHPYRKMYCEQESQWNGNTA